MTTGAQTPRRGTRRGRGWFRRTKVASSAGGSASSAGGARLAEARDGDTGCLGPSPGHAHVPYAPFEHDALYGFKDQDDAGYRPYDFLPTDPALKPYEFLPRNPVSRPSGSPSWPDDPAPQPADPVPKPDDDLPSTRPRSDGPGRLALTGA